MSIFEIDLIKFKILSFLNYNEKAKLRLVSRRVKLSLESTKFSSLVLTNSEFSGRKWAHNNQPIKRTDLLLVDNVRSLKSLMAFIDDKHVAWMFSDLKNLYIDESFISLIKNSSFMLNYPLGSSYSILVQFLNELRSLETLQIGADLGFSCHQATIRLDQLRYLRLCSSTNAADSSAGYFRDLLIESKSIRTLDIDHAVVDTEIAYKNQITDLKINNIACDKLDVYQALLEFKSLKALHLIGIDSNISFNCLINLIRCLPKFSRLILHSHGGFKAENLQRLTHSKRLKEIKNLEIFVNGIDLASLSELIDGFTEDEIILEENGIFSYLDLFGCKVSLFEEWHENSSPIVLLASVLFLRRKQRRNRPVLGDP